MEPTRPTVRAVMSPLRGAHLAVGHQFGRASDPATTRSSPLGRVVSVGGSSGSFAGAPSGGVGPRQPVAVRPDPIAATARRGSPTAITPRVIRVEGKARDGADADGRGRENPLTAGVCGRARTGGAQLIAPPLILTV